MTFDGALSFCGDLEGQATESQVKATTSGYSRWLDEFDIYTSLSIIRISIIRIIV